MSEPELSRLGGLLLLAALAPALFALVSRRPRARIAAAALAFSLAVCGGVAFSDALCLAGYTAADGSCAWE